MVSIWSLEASPTMAQLQQLRTPSSGAQLSTNLRLLIVMLQTIQASFCMIVAAILLVTLLQGDRVKMVQRVVLNNREEELISDGGDEL